MLITVLSLLNCTNTVSGDPTRCAECHCAYKPNEDKSQCIARPTSNANACDAILHCTGCSRDNPNLCTSCLEAYMPSADGCSCEFKDKACLFFNAVSNQCTQCRFTVGLLDGKCLSCQPGCANCTFARVGGQIVETCLDCCAEGLEFHFYNPHENLTHVCPAGANYTISGGRCLSCADEALYGAGCLSCTPGGCTLCAGTAQFINQDGKCQACSQYCLKCDRGGCLQCQASAGGLTVFHDQGVCFTCNDTSKYGEGCLTCGLSGCISCAQSGSSVIAGKCQRCPALCSACSSTSFCTACTLGYAPHDGACFDCGLPMYGQNCGRCSGSGCISCKSTANQTVVAGKCTTCAQGCAECEGSVCTRCGEGYSLYGQRCYRCDSEAVFGPHCAQCDDSVCRQCSPLYPNYYLAAGKCNECPVTCASCTGPQSCSVCAGPKISLVGGVCYNCSLPQYGTGCQSCSASGCSACTSSSGVGIVEGKCAACGQLCEACNDTGCTRCLSSSKVILDNGICINCSANFGTYCQGCSPQACTVCTQSGYNVDANGICSKCPANCDNCTGGSCTKCRTGYFQQNGLCSPCHTNCTQCTASGCTACRSGYALQEGACLLCKDAFTGCTSCTLSACTSCTNQGSGVSLSGGRCVDCKIYGASCLTCTADSCTACGNGSFLGNKTCASCGVNCRTCSSPEVCSNCYSGFFNDGGVCRNCSDGRYGTSCLECNSANCTRCNTSANTPAFVHSINAGKCIQCGENCSSCGTSPCDGCRNQDDGISFVGGRCIDCSQSKYGKNCASCSESACIACNTTGYNVVGG